MSLQKVPVDIIGPIPHTSSEGYRYASNIIDWSSRYPEVVPLRTITSKAIYKALLNFFTKFGFPTTILSDNGSQFKSELTGCLDKLLGIEHIFTSIYHPQSNGICERFNQTVKSMLYKVSMDHPSQWPDYLPMIMFAYRETPHLSTGFSLFQILFGGNPKSPMSLLSNRIIPG